MPSDFFDPEQQIIVLVTATILMDAERSIAFCERCNPESSDFTFDMILDQVTGSDPRSTEYLLEVPARCPNCKQNVFEKTLVAPYSP